MLAIVAGGLWVLLVLGCGKRGDPLPPLRLVPAAVEEISVSQRGDAIRLEWRAPERNTDGSRNVELATAEILRRVLDPLPAASREQADLGLPEEPEEDSSREQEEEVDSSDTDAEAMVDATTPPAAAVPSEVPFPQQAVVVAQVVSRTAGERLIYHDVGVTAAGGKRTEYAVRYRNRRNAASRLSPVVGIAPRPPVPVPRGLRLEVGDGFVRVRWQPGTASAEPGATDIGFNVFRRTGEASYPARPANVQPLVEPRFSDGEIRYHQSHCYVVRALVLDASAPSPVAEQPLIESETSEETCVTPVDTFAPASPVDLVALASPQGIVLSWGPVEARDLEGYWVYRATDPQGPYERRTAAPLVLAAYTDGEVEPGVTYYYAVSAVDTAQPPNESERSESVAVSVLAPP